MPTTEPGGRFGLYMTATDVPVLSWIGTGCLFVVRVKVFASIVTVRMCRSKYFPRSRLQLPALTLVGCQITGVILVTID